MLVRDPKTRKYIPIYHKSWDGNPWYDVKRHRKHSLECYKAHKERTKTEIPEFFRDELFEE